MRRLGQVVLGLFALFLVVRAIAEPFVIDAGNPESYQNDWGGPHYLGVMLVHCGPGLIIVIVSALYARKRWLRREETGPR